MVFYQEISSTIDGSYESLKWKMILSSIKGALSLR